MMPVMEAKRAESPKASGPYMRVIIGAAKITRAWAVAVPPTSLRTSEAKEELCNRVLENRSFIPFIGLSMYSI